MMRPEILAPAGNWECLTAAIENGADAVYFGLQCGFNARARAANFPMDDLEAVVERLHSRGVRGFVTLNTLVFTSELEEFERVVRRVAASGADAVLVQDLGVVSLIRKLCPDLAIHASTQMTLTSAECIREAEAMGVERVVLARELSIDEIRKIREQTQVELEAFVHGALCVAYSGQCLTSESLGGRSANRGQCAQACRLPYDLICDGEPVDLGDMKYLLSPQDLAAYALTPELIEAGVCSLKIEGRLKTPEYVANVTKHYRDAAEQAVRQGEVRIDNASVEEMELSFSRGFSPGWLRGCDHKMLVPGLSSAKRGVLLGEVQEIRGGQVFVRLQRSIQKGDGVVFEGDRIQGEEQGGRVYQVTRNGAKCDEPVKRGVVGLAFQREALDLQRIEIGHKIWKTDDPHLTARLRRTFAGPDPQRKTPIRIEAVAKVDQPLLITVKSPHFEPISLQTDHVLEPARKHPLTEEVLRKQLGRLGGVEFTLDALRLTANDKVMVPLSILGKLRKEMVAQMRGAMQQRPPRRLADAPVIPQLREALQSTASERGFEDGSERQDQVPQLLVLCRTLEQLRGALDCGVRDLMADFQDIREYREAAEICRDRQLWLATPRIQKPGEMGVFQAMRKHGAHGVLARNLSGMRFCRDQGIPFVADFSLNAANELTVDVLFRHGAQRVTASYDLNREQLFEMVRATPQRRGLEVVIHQHMPMFHMEHCVFCAAISPGTNKHNCGRPCDDHLVELKDRVGVAHPLTADVGCRNTLYNATPQSAAEMAPGLLAEGVVNYRVELLRENSQQAARTIDLYRKLLAGKTSGKSVWKALNAANRVGVTRGSLETRRDPLAII